MNWLQAAKELVKLIHGEIYSSLSVIFKKYFLTKSTKFLASLILRRSRSFATFVTRSLPLILAGKSADELMRSFVELIVLWTFSIQSWFIYSFIRNWIAYANEPSIVNKYCMFSKQALSCKIEQSKGVWEDLHYSSGLPYCWRNTVFSFKLLTREFCVLGFWAEQRDRIVNKDGEL